MKPNIQAGKGVGDHTVDGVGEYDLWEVIRWVGGQAGEEVEDQAGNLGESSWWKASTIL